jgi:hypothetical protein
VVSLDGLRAVPPDAPSDWLRKLLPYYVISAVLSDQPNESGWVEARLSRAGAVAGGGRQGGGLGAVARYVCQVHAARDRAPPAMEPRE